jgi:RTA1 like protein
MITGTFVTCDVVTFLIQCAGGGLLATANSDQSKANLGSHILVVGLALQVITFSFFAAASIWFVFKMKHQKELPIEVHYSARKRKVLMRCLWASCFFIIVRK